MKFGKLIDEALQAVATHSAEEHLADRVGMEPAAIGLTEHKALVVEVGRSASALRAFAGRRRGWRMRARPMLGVAGWPGVSSWLMFRWVGVDVVQCSE